MNDKILIRELKIETNIGILPWEKHVRQSLTIDVDIATDIRQAAASDCISHTIDYATVCQRITALAHDNHYQLLETLAEEVANMIRRDFPVTWLSLVIYKTDVLNHVAKVGVAIERGEK